MPYNIYFSLVILKVSRAIYNGHLCYFKHLHWTVDLLIIDFKTFIAFLYFEFIGPFLYPYYAHFLIHNWVELIGWPFACSNIRLGFAPFSRAIKDVSKSYCWRLKNKVWLKFCVVMAFIFCVNIRNFINWT